MEFVKITERLPHTKLLKFLSKKELLLVWRDVIYEIKNNGQSSNRVLEQYFVYLLMVYVELKNKGTQPNEKYVSTHTKTSFCYLGGFDKWISTWKAQQYISSQRMCNDNESALFSKHIEKYLKKKDAFITDDIDLIKNSFGNTTSNKELIPVLEEILRGN